MTKHIKDLKMLKSISVSGGTSKYGAWNTVERCLQWDSDFAGKKIIKSIILGEILHLQRQVIIKHLAQQKEIIKNFNYLMNTVIVPTLSESIAATVANIKSW